MSDDGYSSADDEVCDGDMKIFAALEKFEEREQNIAEEILHSIICSSDHLDWKEDSMEIKIDGRVVRGSNIIDLVQYLLYPEDANIAEPSALFEFVKALKMIGLEPDWVCNEKVAAELEEYESDSSSEEESTEEENEDSD